MAALFVYQRQMILMQIVIVIYREKISEEKLFI